MKALVISGGGSKGSFAGEIAEHLIKTQGKNYDIFVGTSVGSLLVNHLALNKIEEINNPRGKPTRYLADESLFLV